MAQRVVTVIGTRPEAIKMAPVVQALARRPDDFAQVVVTTGQHRELLDQTLAAFDIQPSIDLELMQPRQRVDEFAAWALTSVGRLLDELEPDVLLVQGDTTTVMAASLAAFYRDVAVGHVEAGLRSHTQRSPFPEELNRRVTALAATHHFAPTVRARENLLREGVPAGRVHVTGNTIVDALAAIRLPERFSAPELQALELDPEPLRMVLVTAHRRESHGAPLRAVFRALRRLAELHRDVRIVFPVHLNPAVREAAFAELGAVERVVLVPPLDYPDLLLALARSTLVLTDSGGIQEEAPSFNTPVLVLRDVTERPELVESGLGIVVGTETETIVDVASGLLADPGRLAGMALRRNPFGDGRAAERIAGVLAGRSRMEDAVEPRAEVESDHV